MFWDPTRDKREIWHKYFNFLNYIINWYPDDSHSDISRRKSFIIKSFICVNNLLSFWIYLSYKYLWIQWNCYFVGVSSVCVCIFLFCFVLNQHCIILARLWKIIHEVLIKLSLPLVCIVEEYSNNIHVTYFGKKQCSKGKL